MTLAVFERLFFFFSFFFNVVYISKGSFVLVPLLSQSELTARSSLFRHALCTHSVQSEDCDFG